MSILSLNGITYMSYAVREYTPPPLRCFKWQRFGHVANQCRGKFRCAKCGGEHEYGKCAQDAVIVEATIVLLMEGVKSTKRPEIARKRPEIGDQILTI